jgi:hypothetical protein
MTTTAGRLGLLRKYTGQHGVRIWAYCLMTNHLHLVAVPEREESGLPFGGPAFLSRIEHLLGRLLRPKNRGRRPAHGSS